MNNKVFLLIILKNNLIRLIESNVMKNIHFKQIS